MSTIVSACSVSQHRKWAKPTCVVGCWAHVNSFGQVRGGCASFVIEYDTASFSETLSSSCCWWIFSFSVGQKDFIFNVVLYWCTCFWKNCLLAAFSKIVLSLRTSGGWLEIIIFFGRAPRWQAISWIFCTSANGPMAFRSWMFQTFNWMASVEKICGHARSVRNWWMLAVLQAAKGETLSSISVDCRLDVRMCQWSLIRSRGIREMVLSQFSLKIFNLVKHPNH